MSKQKIRVGVVGLGMGKYHIRQYQNDADCQVAAICDMDEGRLDAAAKEFDVPHRFTDVDALLGSGEIDAVSLATPNATHAPLTIQALEAGLHVLCEKPMALNADEAQRMVDTAVAQDKKLAIHFNHRMAASVQWLSRFAHAGDLGEIYFARTTWHRRKGIPGRPSFLNMANSGGGAMIDLGVHMLDQTLYIMGYPKPTAVSAKTFTKFAGKDVPDLNMDVDDFAVALVRFENDAVLELEISWASHHDTHEHIIAQVYGTEGGARRYNEVYKDLETSVYRREHGALTTTVMDQPPAGLTSVQQDFLDAIREDRDPVCSMYHGLSMMKILDAIYRSSREGREVEID